MYIVYIYYFIKLISKEKKIIHFLSKYQNMNQHKIHNFHISKIQKFSLEENSYINVEPMKCFHITISTLLKERNSRHSSIIIFIFILLKISQSLTTATHPMEV